MERLTEKNENGYCVPPAQQARALARLGHWEDMAGQLEQEQVDIAVQLETLRHCWQGEICALPRTVRAQADHLHHA